MIRCFENFDVTCFRNPREAQPKLAIVIPNEIRADPLHKRWLPEEARAVQASVGERVTPTWITLRECSSMMKKANSERKKRSVTCKRVTRPHIFRMVLQEGGPGLSSSPWCASMPHIFLNGSFRDVNAQLQQLTTNTFRSPKAIVPGHLLDQRHSLFRLCASRSLDVSAKNNERLSEERVLGHEFGLASGKICDRPQHERGSGRLCPVDETVVERLKANACQPFDKSESTRHSVCNPFVKMSRRMQFYSTRFLGNLQGASDVGRCSQRSHLADRYGK